MTKFEDSICSIVELFSADALRLEMCLRVRFFRLFLIAPRFGNRWAGGEQKKKKKQAETDPPKVTRRPLENRHSASHTRTHHFDHSLTLFDVIRELSPPSYKLTHSLYSPLLQVYR